ncbi:hypothetical protein AB0K86_06130 [Streptomyces clavifer]|uniref:hypothetical protein n=1 Tax=Streptomyces TaxID=1883 RepID=UPI0006F81699|nr:MULTISPECIES: hypothetical protein [unclassified Streptomyces]KQX77632.1 hypothetical protein ASD26_15480 [Streptomyces sp. Root1319]KQZ10468.1 hypothetical protein ASD51_09515 [Streptomyces sp. Root55]
MTDRTLADIDNIPADMLPEPDLTGLPPRELLPDAVHALYDAREAVWDAYCEYDAAHAELLSMGWESVFARRDEAAGREAVSAGKSPLDVPSALAEAIAQRPRVVGGLHSLISAVNRADQALCAAVRRELGALGESIEASVAEAAQAYADIQQAANEARQHYGARLILRAWHSDWAKLGIRSHYTERTAATPLTVNGVEAKDLYDRPLRGAAEVKAIDESYGRVRVARKATIRTKRGLELTLDINNALAAVNRGDAEFVAGE